MYLTFALRSSSLHRGLNSAQIDMNDPSVLRVDEMFPLSSVPFFPRLFAPGAKMYLNFAVSSSPLHRGLTRRKWI
jgi:hypothetical protein